MYYTFIYNSLLNVLYNDVHNIMEIVATIFHYYGVYMHTHSHYSDLGSGPDNAKLFKALSDLHTEW